MYCIIVMMSINPIASNLVEVNWIVTIMTLAIVYVSACAMSVLFSMMKRVGAALKSICILVVGLYDLLALFCVLVFKTKLDVSIIETLLATNMHEIKEFIGIFFPWWLFVLSFLVLAFIIMTHLYCLYKRRLRMGERHLTMHLYLLTYVVIVMLVCHKQVYAQVTSLQSWVIPFDNLTINLKDYEPSSVALNEISSEHPQKIVLIIGESHSKGHSSIYGYEKETNPRLERLIQDSLAYAFTDVVSPATATTMAFKYILNTRRVIDFKKEWYLYPSIVTIMKSAGYRTSWYSNQDEVGLFDNVASCFAHLCDEYTFNNKEERLDGNLIGLHKACKDKELVIYHLMGQHVDFSQRYPNESFGKFKEKDYDINKCAHRDIAAHYDNACLYNDYVVTSIIDEYKNDDAIVIYFSDHGLDVFQSSPYYFGHVHGFAKKNVKIGFDIPFIVYMSETFQKKHPAVVESVKSSLENRFCTSDVSFMIMDIAGYGFAK